MPSLVRYAVIGLLLITAAGIGGIIYNLSRPAMPVAQVTPGAPAPLQVSYLVAAHSLPAGTLARDEDFTVKSVVSTSVPQGAMSDTPEVRAGLRGALIRKFMDVGSAITADDILRPRDRGFIASVLENGTRAATIGVDPVSGVAGLIWPGDHVDVMLTQTLENAKATHKALSETVLRNVRVIAIDQEMVQGASGDTTAAGKLARTVTVQVDPDQAQKLNVASQMGKLSLSIRSAVDQTDTVTAPTYSVDVSQATRAGTTMRVFEGDKVKEVTFP